MTRQLTPLEDFGQRLGWFAYLTVMGGGIPFWPALFEGPRAVEDLATTRDVVAPSTGNPQALAQVTAPYQYQVAARSVAA